MDNLGKSIVDTDRGNNLGIDTTYAHTDGKNDLATGDLDANRVDNSGKIEVNADIVDNPNIDTTDINRVKANNLRTSIVDEVKNRVDKPRTG